MLVRRRRLFSRGFTMIELLVAISMMAVISALAVAGYLKVVHAAQSAEAHHVLGQIRAGEEAYRAEMLQYLSVSTSMTDYYPNKTPNDTRWAWAQPGDARYYKANPLGGWQLLGVNPDAPVRYGYAVMAGIAPTALPALDSAFQHPPALSTTLASGTAWFVAAAKNEHINQSFKPSLAVTTSYDGHVYTEGTAD